MKLILVLMAMLLSVPSLAADRSSVIQGRVQAALGGILGKQDYLVLVNRLDHLDEGGVSEISQGTVRPLPGLQVGVDARGQVVRQDAGISDYVGDVSVSVLVDQGVKEETFQTIQKNISEIAGGLRDGDEVKVTRSVLRQPARAESATPPMTFNLSAPSQGAQGSSSSPDLKMVALFLMAMGLLAWLFGRAVGKPTESSRSVGPSQAAASAPAERDSKVDLGEIAPFATALYLMQALKRNEKEKVFAWLAQTTAGQQRTVFQQVPAWVSAYIENLVDKTSPPRKDFQPEKAEVLYREMAVLEQALRNDEDRDRAFLLWFPPQALRFVPKHAQASLSDRHRRTLWHFRPDLGDFVNTALASGADFESKPGPIEIADCKQTLYGWPSVVVFKDDGHAKDPVTAWVSIINQLSEFGPIASQMKHAEKQLGPEEYRKVAGSVAHLESPFLFDSRQLKEWLRSVDPQDYYWWKSLTGRSELPWALESELRPMRLAMFEFAEANPLHLRWAESEKKAAAARILSQMRRIISNEAADDVAQVA